jgi:aldehyde:ferredoxin oxidoreductase
MKQVGAARGYMGKILDVNLTTGNMHDEGLDETMCRQYLGGYGLGARLLYERIPAGADALGPNNVLGLLTGPLTGTPAVIGSRFVAVAKSPKTGGWGDANCGGYFGPQLKFAGYDGILFSGIAHQPVYLYIEDGHAELRDASDLWGMGVTPLEDALKGRQGRGVEICSIGPSGEQLSLLSCIMNDKERAAGRSGLGAVMGSKKLKAVVVKGKMKVPVADEERIKALRKELIAHKGGGFDGLHNTGTCGITEGSALNGDSPVKNWGGVGLRDFGEERAHHITGEVIVQAKGYKRYGCWGCPIACGGKVVQRGGKFPLELNSGVGHKPEYETLCMFGTNLLNDDLASIVRVNEICNNQGLDTISTGATIAYAIELYENGLLSKKQTDGLELTWGNAEAIVGLTEKIGRREGFGAVLADGVRVAWERLGRIGTDFAVHVDGEELAAHDPRCTPGLATTYWLNPTPGRHTQGGELTTPIGYVLPKDKYVYSGTGRTHWELMADIETLSAAGMCMFGYFSFPLSAIADQLSAVTGWPFDLETVRETGARIFTMRHAFNLRQGICVMERNVPRRMIGDPPLTKGPLKGVTVDLTTLVRDFLEYLGWDTQTAVPSAESLRKLGMGFVVDDLHTK